MNTDQLLRSIKDATKALGAASLKGVASHVKASVVGDDEGWVAEVRVEVTGNLDFVVNVKNPEASPNVQVENLGVLEFKSRVCGSPHEAAMNLYNVVHDQVRDLYYATERLMMTFKHQKASIQAGSGPDRAQRMEQAMVEPAIVMESAGLLDTGAADPVLEEAWRPETPVENVPDISPGASASVVFTVQAP